MAEQVVGVVTKQGTDISQLINSAANRLNGPPRLLAALFEAESGLDEMARRPHDPARDLAQWPDVSMGLGQQTVKYATTFGLGDGSPNPENIVNVSDQLMHSLPLAIYIAARQVYLGWTLYGDPLKALYFYNAPGLKGEPAGTMQALNYQRAWAVSAKYVQEEAPMSYDADTSIEHQLQSWTCSVRSTTWLLRSLGIATDAATIQDRMVGASLVSPALGLLDGSGADLARFLAARWGLSVERNAAADWDWLCARAGNGPIIMGSSTWYHWIGVRRVQDDHTLAIMNPADGYKGVWQTLDRGQFNHFAPFSALYVPPAADPAPAPPNEEDALSESERADLDYYSAEFSELRDKRLVTIEVNLAKLQAVQLPKAVGDAVEQIAAVAKALREELGAPAA